MRGYRRCGACLTRRLGLFALAGWPQTAASVLRAMGPAGVARRARYEAERRSGLLRRRLPLGAGPVVPQVAPNARIDLAVVQAALATLPDADARRADAVARAEEVLAGRLRLFHGPPVDVGWPPRWRTHPLSGREYPRGVHWTAVSDADPDHDIKLVWEPSRLGFVFTLARAFALSGDHRYPTAVWDAIADWAAVNPVNDGPAWACAQESSLRGLAVVFAVLACQDEPTSMASRQRLAAGLLAALGERVDATLHYAASQRNNHALSEAVFLSTLALLYPRWPQAARWRRRGGRLLREALDDQCYPDGGYAQHAVVYHRMAVQLLLWHAAVHRWAGQPLPDLVVEPLRRSVRLLHALQDPGSGFLPNLGSNDGTLLLPLTGCAYRDFRPTLQAASLLVDSQRLYPRGPWDEEAAWLCPDALAATGPALPDRPAQVVAPDAGLLVTRGRESVAVLRTSPDWRHRPSQADDLHVDIWVGGHEVAGDPGTYRYTAPPPWDNGLAASRVHNTVTMDGQDRLHRRGRFLTSAWPRTDVLLDHREPDGHVWVAESTVPAWEGTGGRHRRLLARRADRYLVADLVAADPGFRPEVHWNLPADAELEPGAGGRWVRSAAWSAYLLPPAGAEVDEQLAGPGPQGWRAPTYSVLEPALAVTIHCPSGRSTVLAAFGPDLPHPPDTAVVLAATALLEHPAARPADALLDGLLPDSRPSP